MKSVVIIGELIIVNNVMVDIINFNDFDIFVINLWVLFKLLLELYFVKMGINVLEKVFLVNKWCRKLGIWLVKRKIFDIVFVFSIFVMIILWIKFSMWEMRVSLLINIFDFRSFLFIVFLS